MDCIRARESMLEADLAELRETGESPLSKHLFLCTGCREVADRILADELTLAQELAKLRSRVSLDTVASPQSGWNQRRRTRTGFVPALAAAGLAGVLVSTVLIMPVDRAPPDTGATETLPPAPEVDPPSDRNVVVFETDNPNIVIVWFY